MNAYLKYAEGRSDIRHQRNVKVPAVPQGWGGQWL